MEGYMLKASFQLPNGTLVTIEGVPEDIRNLLDHYSSFHPTESKLPKPRSSSNNPPQDALPTGSKGVAPDTLSQVVNLIKSCPEAEAIKKYILNKEKSKEADRVMLPLYIVHE